MKAMKDSGIEWIGEIPQHWSVLSQKRLMRKVKNICAKWSGENILSLTVNGVVIRDINNGKGKFPATFDGYQYAEPGNLLLCLFDIDVTPRCVGLITNQGVTSPAYSQYELLDGANARFYNYYLQSMDDRKLYLGQTSTMRYSLTPELFGAILAVRPPLEEQQRIADYLDQKCIEIDRAVASAEQSIREYNEYKQSLIFQITTKGLKPHATMKDSGIQWVGEIPQEWEIRRMGQLANEVKNPNVGMREDNLLSLSYGQIKRKSINSSEGLVPASYETYNIIDCDDIVFRFTDLQNDHKSLRVGRATESGIITSAYVTVRPIQSENSRFMAYAMHSYDFCKGFYGMGSGIRQGLKWQEAKYISIPWPKEDERQRIADYLDQKCIEIDRAIKAKKHIIEELKDYKQSLIFEVVTGKKEVGKC